MADREFWIKTFKDRGWMDAKGAFLPGRVELAGVSFVGLPKGHLGLKYVVEVTEEFLVFEYPYEAPLIRMPWQEDHPSGKTKIWLPWSEIRYVWENRK